MRRFLDGRVGWEYLGIKLGEGKRALGKRGYVKKGMEVREGVKKLEEWRMDEEIRNYYLGFNALVVFRE